MLSSTHYIITDEKTHERYIYRIQTMLTKYSYHTIQENLIWDGPYWIEIEKDRTIDGYLEPLWIWLGIPSLIFSIFVIKGMGRKKSEA